MDASAHSADGDREVVTYDPAAVDDDEEVALTLVRPGLEAIGKPAWAAHIDSCPTPPSCGREFARTMPADWVRELSIVGAPDQARAAIAARHAAGATIVVLTLACPDAFACLALALPDRSCHPQIGEQSDRGIRTRHHSTHPLHRAGRPYCRAAGLVRKRGPAHETLHSSGINICARGRRL
ncbi:hypothetical protein ACFTXJ_13175 [Streptomyces zhihengii]|uniref:hypothetical protein n=1 Tax=Streptomyces zhihengii TaxID=1818004 RepID=UPI003628D9DA